ncbi:MAG: hypothetical protein GOVbin1782_107 [Prokaryotic dsDNA virus sp.]|nr:MAG: hypothetical protein GOVbin1782_107 [Prokaryotic dsDNA virus sp.]|tara:strand:+ start:2991 stop:13520 length:10530 start_codon:yes stop_codon:yes gene_type:complete
MTKGMGNFTGVFAMGKGITESTSGQVKISTAPTSNTNYANNFLQQAIYKTPLNPLLTRGTVTENFDDFTAATADATINSYEIHKADNTVLTNSVNGINQSNSSTQTYSAVNRVYPNSTTISDHLSNLESTRGNQLKIFDYLTLTGQSFVNIRTTLNGAIDDSTTQVVVDSTASIAAGDVIIIENEQMFVMRVVGSTLQVIRGHNNSIITSHADESQVYEIDNIDHLWVLVYSDDANQHHFAKITEILQDDIFGDKIEFSPSLGVDIPKDTKFAIFSSLNSSLPKIDSDNQTLVACAYGLQASDSSIRHHINTHVSRPFFFFLNGKDRLEPATRYILRSSSWNGSSHTYTYSTFVTDQEHEAHIVDYGPFTMEATLVDMMYKADDPAAMDYIVFADNGIALNENGSSADTITLAAVNGEAFQGASGATITNNGTETLDGDRTAWGLNGILRDTRIVIRNATNGSNNDTYCIDSATDVTATTMTLDVGDLAADQAASTDPALDAVFLIIDVLSCSVDLDHNKMYCPVDSSNHLKNSFRMANRTTDDALYSTKTGYSRYMHYCDSPLTNTIIPNAMEMIEYESVTSTGGYVDIVFADTQKILAKKIKEGDSLLINQIVESEIVGKERTFPIAEIDRNTGSFSASSGVNTLEAINLGNEKDMRFFLSSVILNSSTSTTSRYDPLYDTITTNVDGTLYHFNIDTIFNKSNSNQNGTMQFMKVRSWRKATDTEYALTSASPMTNVPTFNATAFRRKYSFLADNLLTNIPIDTKINNYILTGAFSSNADGWNRNVTNFERLTQTLNPINDNLTGTGANTRPSLNVGEVQLERASQSRNNDIHLVLKGGQVTGHRIKVEYGDKHNSFLKLQTHLKDERLLENFNKTDDLVGLYSGLKTTHTSLYSYPVNSGNDADGNPRYDLARSNTSTRFYARGILSYLDYFSGTIDIEKTVFKGTVESVEQVIEDGMFKLKIRGRNTASELLGPVINKDFKFTEDIVYSTVGPVERMARVTKVDTTVTDHATHGITYTDDGVYPVGTTEIQISGITSSSDNPTIQKGDLLYTSQGIFLGRVHKITDVAGDGNFTPAVILFEEGIPTRLKDGEAIMCSFYETPTETFDFSSSDQLDVSSTVSTTRIPIRGNTISLAKSLSSNPYTTTRVNSLLGAKDKGIIFTGGKSLSLTDDNAPFKDGSNLVGTSSSSNPLAKGYSINSPEGIDFDFPFYCNVADEISNKYGVNYVNLHTVNSLTEYDVINLSSNERETVIEMAPICPAVLARVDNNPIDSRDKYLLQIGAFTSSEILGYNGVFQIAQASWMEELKQGDFIFDENGELFGKIIDISLGSSDGILNDRVAFTLDRPLFKTISATEKIMKYYGNASPAQYFSGTTIKFDGNSVAGTSFGSTQGWSVARLFSSDSATQTFLQSLEAGMRIKIEGPTNTLDNIGIFSVAHVFEDDTNDSEVILFTRKHPNGKKTTQSQGSFRDDTSGQTVRITVLTDYFTQGLYFLNTQGLSQGGVLTLTNPILSSPNEADNNCKPIKWASSLYHHITDTSLAHASGGIYNPNASAPTIFSDMIDRYGNTKWRYFGLQKGKYLSYINRRLKDGKIKTTYSLEKGKVNGYATAYRISDAKYGKNKLMKFPYGYHNNDFAWGVFRTTYTSSSDTSLGTSDYYTAEFTNGIKHNLSFLEYLSPESRDFRPVMGSNFADFDKYGTAIITPDHPRYRVGIYPRFMARLHDNHRGGDWQEDLDAPENSTIPHTILKYRKWKALSTDSNDFDYDIDYAGTGNPTYIDPNAGNSDTITQSLDSQWVKIGGQNDKNNNRTFKLSALGADVSGKFTLDVTKPPFTKIGTHTDTGAVGGSAQNSTGFEEITILHSPFIGPKFDGITRAKDHWELPDPKALRWFIFSPADMYPDSMSRKHHIGYSGIVNYDSSSETAISRRFSDYSLLLKSKSSFSNSNTPHEYYEGSLQNEEEIDDNYITVPISDSSIAPSQMKRFGLMRLIDCTYDWHFNLIDPERLPSDITQMTTPNFEYTRYQGLKKIHLRTTGSELFPAFYGDNNTIINLTGNPNSLLQKGDQLFTNTGHYIGKVKRTANAVTDSTCDVTNGDATITCDASANVFVGMEVRPSGSLSGWPSGQVSVTSINTGTEGTNVTSFEISSNYTGSTTSNVSLIFEHHIELEGASRKIIKSDGSAGLYDGYLYIVSDGTSTLAEQDYWDSFFRFHTKGKGGKNTFTVPTESVETHMLQQMWNAASHDASSQDTTYDLIPHTYHPVNGVKPYFFFQIPYGVVEQADDDSHGPLATNNPIGLAVNDDAYQKSDAGPDNTDIDVNISEPSNDDPSPKFLSSFTRNFIQAMGPQAIIDPVSNATDTSTGDTNYLTNLATTRYNPIIALPPAFRTFYATSASRISTGLTINNMQEKKYLVTKARTPINSGVFVNESDFSAGSQFTITVDDGSGGDSLATTKFPVNSVVYDPSNNPVGKVKAVTATQITLFSRNAKDLDNNDELHFTEDNTIDTEYCHPSNVLEFIQHGGNPYAGCSVISLASYTVEDSLPTNLPVGARTFIRNLQQKITKNFGHSRPKLTSPASSDSDRSEAIYGDGTGKLNTQTPFSNKSNEFNFLTTLGNFKSGFANSNSDLTQNANSFSYVGQGTGYVANGVFGVFHPELFLGGMEKVSLGAASGTQSEAENDKGLFAFHSINQQSRNSITDLKPDLGVLRILSSISPNETGASRNFNHNDKNSWLNFVDLTGMYLVANFGTEEGQKTTRRNFAPFSGELTVNTYGQVQPIEAYDIPAALVSPVFGTDGERSTKTRVIEEEFFLSNCSYSTSNAIVTYTGEEDIRNILRAGMIVKGYGMVAGGVVINSVDSATQFTLSHTPNAGPVLPDGSAGSNTLGFIGSGGGVTGLDNCMVDPDHIIYVHEHRRNVTGKEVAHELLIDNIPYNKNGEAQFFNNYRVMRPAETCLWPNSPNEISIGKLSGSTTKQPQSELMYGYVPSITNISSNNNFTGPDEEQILSDFAGFMGDNEPPMSMYLAVDMDARHSQYQTLGAININDKSSTVTSSGLFTSDKIQEGDVIKLKHSKYFVKSIESVNSLTIAGQYRGGNLTNETAYVCNNTYTVLRNYSHLFNPSGNRNTFKDGSSYNMLLTDGINRQKISMGVNTNYYDESSLCKLSIGSIENPFLGLVSFGEIFTIKSNVPVNLSDITSARIGSTLVIGSEVEDIVNNILSDEGISYDISDNREYPYYISPNFQGVDLFNASNFAAKYKQKEIRIDEKGISLIRQSNDLDFRDITLSYENKDLKIISVTRNKSTFDLYNEVIVYGNGVKSIKRNRKSIDKFGKKTLEEVNMELISQDDVDEKAKKLLKAHSEGDDRFTVRMSVTGIEFIKAGDIVTLDFPSEGVPKNTYKVYEIRRELKGLIELEVGTYRKDLANRFAELSMLNKSNAASIRGSQFTATTAPLDFFDSVKLKELSLVIRRIGLADTNAFTLGFQTSTSRKLDFGATMGPQETITEIIREEDLT